MIFFEVLTKFFVGGGADTPQTASHEGGFEHVGGVHGASAGISCTDECMDFVDEEDDIGLLFEFLDDGFESFFEVASVSGPCKERPKVELVYEGVGEGFGDLAFEDFEGESFDDGGFSDACFSDEQGIIFVSSHEDVDDAIDFVMSSDEGVDKALGCTFYEVDGVGFEVFVFFCFFGGVFGGCTLGGVLSIFFVVGGRACFGDSVAYVFDGIESCHFLSFKEVDGVAFSFVEHGDEDVGPGDFFPS